MLEDIACLGVRRLMSVSEICNTKPITFLFNIVKEFHLLLHNPGINMTGTLAGKVIIWKLNS